MEGHEEKLGNAIPPSHISRGADGRVCVLPSGCPTGENVFVRFPSGNVAATRDELGAVFCTPPPSSTPAVYTVVVRTGADGDTVVGTGIVQGVAPVSRRADGSVCCASREVCPPDAVDLLCHFPSGDYAAVLDQNGSVCCRPPASSKPVEFRVSAQGTDGARIPLGSGVMAASIAGMRAFASMSLCYLLFTTTDGALRMIVLFHAFTLGFSAWDVALMFALYELAGVATNLLAGVAGTRWGIKSTLLCGLGIQVAGICMLYGFDIAWSDPGARWKALAWVAVANGIGGVAKDLVKLGGKTVSKLVTPDEKQSRLFAVVAWLTGMKNSMKGVGYFIGAASLSVSLEFALGLNLVLIGVALPIAILGLQRDIGKARSRSVSLRAMLIPAANVRRLSFARAFLFGSRDLWFEVVLPFYMRDAVQGLGWSRFVVGASLAAFIIIYGQIQTATPRFVLSPLRQEPANKLVQVLWNTLLTAIPLTLALVFMFSDAFVGHQLTNMEAALCILLACFCVIFAINSSIHSYLIVRYSAGDKVAADVGFYYMSNAAGRFVGTLVSGALYQWSAGGDKTAAMGWCFLASAAFSLASALLTLRIDDQHAGLTCGPWRLVRERGAKDVTPSATSISSSSAGGDFKLVEDASGQLFEGAAKEVASTVAAATASRA